METQSIITDVTRSISLKRACPRRRRTTWPRGWRPARVCFLAADRSLGQLSTSRLPAEHFSWSFKAAINATWSDAWQLWSDSLVCGGSTGLQMTTAHLRLCSDVPCDWREQKDSLTQNVTYLRDPDAPIPSRCQIYILPFSVTEMKTYRLTEFISFEKITNPIHHGYEAVY